MYSYPFRFQNRSVALSTNDADAVRSRIRHYWDTVKGERALNVDFGAALLVSRSTGDLNALIGAARADLGGFIPEVTHVLTVTMHDQAVFIRHTWGTGGAIETLEVQTP